MRLSTGFVNSITYSYVCALLVCSQFYADRQLFKTTASNAWLRQRRRVREKDITAQQLSNCGKSSKNSVVLQGGIGSTSGLGALSTRRWIVSADGKRCMVVAAIFKLPTQHSPLVIHLLSRWVTI